MNNSQKFMVLFLVVVATLLSCGTSDNGISDLAFNSTVAFAGEDRYVTVNTHVVLDGSDSKQGPEGDLVYHWVQIGGPAIEVGEESGVRVTIMLPEAGEYLFELRVSSQNKVLSSDEIRLIALKPNEHGDIRLDDLPLAFEEGYNPLRDLLVAYAVLADTTNGEKKENEVVITIRNLLKSDNEQRSIAHFYLSPRNVEFWGKNLLKESLLGYDEEVSWFVKPGQYEIRAIDEQGVEFFSERNIEGRLVDWDLTAGEMTNNPINIRRAKKLMGELKLCFRRENTEQVYHYKMFSQVEPQATLDEYLVRGKSLSDDAMVSASFVPILNRYQLRHNNSNNNLHYRYVFRIMGDSVEGVVEILHHISGKSEYELVDALPLLPASRVAVKKLR
ncbi:MAG: hypothetical protein VX294_14480 [Candidatus Latescibacterota bacterium]|nr:hypothetical protein [Candidatus Latescibacterota bacterium]